MAYIINGKSNKKFWGFAIHIKLNREGSFTSKFQIILKNTSYLRTNLTNQGPGITIVWYTNINMIIMYKNTGENQLDARKTNGPFPVYLKTRGGNHNIGIDQ